MRLLFAIAALLLAASAATAQENAPANAGHGELISVTAEALGIEGTAYIVFRPRAVRQGTLYPLVWTVPNEDETVEDAVRAMTPLSTDRRPVFVAGMPTTPETDEERDPTTPYGEICSGFLESVVAEHPIDPGRIAMHGRGFGADFVSVWSYQHQREHRDAAPLREIWFSEGGLPQPEDARATRLRFFVGKSADGDDGPGEIVLGARRVFRFMAERAYDVWYSERKGSGRGVDEPLRKEMRAVIEQWSSYAGALPESAATAPIIATARDFAVRGWLDDAFATLAVVVNCDADTPGISEDTRTAAAKATKALRQWLRRHAKNEERRIVRQRSVSSYHELEAHRDSLPEDDGLRSALTAVLDKIRRSETMVPELAAEVAFKKALVELRKDPKSGRGLLAELAGRAYPDTVYGRRARGHLRGQYDR